MLLTVPPEGAAFVERCEGLLLGAVGAHEEEGVPDAELLGPSADLPAHSGEDGLEDRPAELGSLAISVVGRVARSR